MATSPKEISLRMAFRKKSDEELKAIVEKNEDELEASIASDELEKRASGEKKPKVPKKKIVLTTQEKEEKIAEKEALPHPELTDEEARALAEAEVEFETRQANRKTSSKEDKSMKEEAEKEEKAKKKYAETHKRETKRQTLEESNDVPGLKVGSKVTLKHNPKEGVILRIYISSDGKEKAMVQFGEGAAVKKRITSLVLKD